MISVSLRTASLALAAGGLALSAPVSAFPDSHRFVRGMSAVHGVTSAQYDDDDDDDDGDRGRRRGWYKKDRHDRYDRRYDRYRSGYQSRPYYSGYPANYGEPVRHNTRVWRGQDNRYYCRKSDGTTGLLIGGAVGALLGREVAGHGDRTLGAILGAAGGALLGKSIDSRIRCR